MKWTEKERAAFVRHEIEQRRHEAQMTFVQRLKMLEQMQATARMFGHVMRPEWAQPKK
jgi:hypothetical protein